MNHDSIQQKRILDQHIRNTIQHHFDPSTGSRYWLEKAKKLGIDPINDINCFEDLSQLGILDENDLRTIPVEEFTARKNLDFTKYSPKIYETGGTSGSPKRVLDTIHQEENAIWVCEVIEQHGFTDKGNWLNMFPSGPHAVSHFTYSIARKREEFCYFIDIDPRWVKRCIKDIRNDILELYVDHILTQAVDLLEKQNISYIFTTPKLLEALLEKVDISDMGVKGILCGGTRITPEFHKLLRTEMIPDIKFCALYGNTLMGVAPQVPVQSKSPGTSKWSIDYYGYSPHFIIQIVNEVNPDKLVDYLERGRVKITVLNQDVFIPALLERDVGTRIMPVEEFPWDGIADVDVYGEMKQSITEGVY